LEGTAADW
jgi:hypothetical protein